MSTTCPIVQDDADRAAFVEMLGELVERTGWGLLAWVLMGDRAERPEKPNPFL